MSAESPLLLPEKKPRIAILGSGSGTTAEALALGTLNGTLDAEIALFITNNKNPNAGMLQRAQRLNAQGLRIGTRVIRDDEQPHGEQSLKEAQEIADEIEINNISLVLLMGYMKRVREPLLGLRPMLNWHPGLLPVSAGKIGKGVQMFALSEGHRESGSTVHIVDGSYDTGEIISEHPVPIMPWDDADTLFAAVQAAEKADAAPIVDNFIHTRLAAELAKLGLKVS